MPNAKRILIAPLNWGLGHASRCIPIVNALQKEGAEVLLASDGRAHQLLEKEFPELPLFEIPGYGINYKTSSMMFNMATQLPKIISAIYQEHKAVNKLVKEENIDVIISDNRYGCHSKNAHNVFITHQFNIKIPLRPFEMMISYLNQKRISQFDECWIPDFEGIPNLSGALSHGINIDLEEVHYVGLLSRMKKFKAKKKYDFIVVLSGPDPQRSYLEKKIIRQAKDMEHSKFLIVKGETETDERTNLTDQIEIVSYLTTEELNKAIMQSDVVISRSGYSTIMDLVNLGKKALLVPTPGQTEQEYLANQLYATKIFYTQQQSSLNLENAIPEIQAFTGFSKIVFPEANLKKVIKSLLAKPS